MNYLTTYSNLPSIFEEVFFKDFFEDDFFNPLPSLRKIDYPVDIYETDDGLVIDIAAVGLDKSDIKIDVKGDTITVSHEKEEKKESKEKYAYRGITRKSFNFAWRIGDRFDINKTKATLDKGLLKITVPIATEKKPREISIEIC